MLFFSGSSQIASVDWKLASAAANFTKRMFDDDLAVSIIDLAEFELPNYSPMHGDADEMPAGVVMLRDTIASSDGIFVSSDEYTGAYSAALKNAIRWLTHNASDKEALFDGLPVALCGASLRGAGGLRGQPALGQMFTEQGAIVISQHLELGTSAGLFDPGGRLLSKVEKQLVDGALGKLFVAATTKKRASLVMN